MATILWKDGKPGRFEASAVKSAIGQGWSPDEPGVEPPSNEGGPFHIGNLEIPPDATPLQAQEIVLGKMNIRV